MEIRKIDDSKVSVIATQGQWAQLSKIIDWVIVEGGDMDDAYVSLRPEDICKVLREWKKVTTDAISQ